MVGDYLRGNGYEVDTAPSLAAGRELLRSGPTTRWCST
jgi:DNA-binding response OmpR family regulator